MSEKKFSEYIVELLRSGKHLVYVQGQGGVGKSTALLECYRKLLVESHLNIIPIFVPVEQCNDDEFAIRRYVYTHYLGGEKGTDVMTAYMNLQQLFEADGDYRYVLLLDGWNEHFSAGRLVTEVENLSRYEKVSIVLTGREAVRDFLDWERVKLVPLSEEFVDRMVPGATEEVRKLLTIPFYLSRYLELKDEGVDVRILSAGTLLQQYVDFTVEKFRRANTYAKMKDIDLPEALRIVKDEWFPMLCLEIALQGKMDFSTRDIKLKERIREIPTELDIDMGTVCRKLLIPMGFVTEIGMNRFKVVHELYRDWFSATYLHQLLQEHAYTTEEIIEIFSRHVSRDIMCFCVDSFEKKDEIIDILRDINGSVTKREDLRQNERLNKNIVDFFATVSPILEGVDLSHRNLSMVSFGDFCRLRVNFSGSVFSGAAFDGLRRMERARPLSYTNRKEIGDVVLFPELGCIICCVGSELHRVDYINGRDSLLIESCYTKALYGKYDEYTFYEAYSFPRGGREVKLFDVRHGIYVGCIDEGEVDAIMERKLEERMCQKETKGICRYSFTEHEVYLTSDLKGNRKKVLKSDDKIEKLVELNDRLLVITENRLTCYENAFNDVLYTKWSLNRYEMEMWPIIMEGLFYKIEQQDKTSTWAKVIYRQEQGSSQVQILKRFETDKKEPILLCDGFVLFAEVGRGELYTIDEQSMRYKKIIDFNENSKEDERRFFSETEIKKGICCSDGKIVIQVKKHVKYNDNKQLEFYSVNLSGEYVLLFSWTYKTEVQTLMCTDRIVLWDKKENNADNLFVVMYTGEIVYTGRVQLDGEIRLHCFEDKIFFLPDEWISKSYNIVYLDFTTYKTGILQMVLPKFSVDEKVRFIGIKQILYFGEKKNNNGLNEIYEHVCDTERDGNKLYVGRKIIEMLDDRLQLHYRTGWTLFLCNEAMGDSVSDVGEENFHAVYKGFTHDLSGTVFKDVKGFTEEELGILKLYGAEGIKDKTHVTSREQFEREDFLDWEVQQEDALEDDEFSFKTVR